ncbi:ribonuclease H-like domain-containing protein [Tanacetum coccineum]
MYGYTLAVPWRVEMLWLYLDVQDESICIVVIRRSTDGVDAVRLTIGGSTDESICMFVIISVHNSEHNSLVNSDHDDDIHDSVTRIKGKNKIGIIDSTCKRSNTDEILGKQWDRNGSSIADYYHKLNALWKQYDAMIELPKCVCNVSEVTVGSIAGSFQRNQASAFVSSVPNSQHFQRNNQNFSVGPSRPNNMNNNRQSGGSGLNNNKPSGGSGLMCENYDFNGHTIDRCFKIIGYPADFGKKKSGQNFTKQSVSNNNYVGKSSSSGFSNEQMATLLSLLKDNINGKNVHANTAGFESKNVLGLVICVKGYTTIMNKVCQRAKQTREPFPLSDHVSSSLGELVHLDLWGPYRVTSSEGFKLPSSVLNRKSPYEMIYKKCHSLSHLRVFGCLCFATLVNSSDKFGSRSKKCVLIGYSSVKKGYRLYSLDKHQFMFSRDVKFFENIFPFKDSDKVKDVIEKVFQDVNRINFFDLEYPETPNDDERVDPKLNCDNKKSQSASSSSSESGGISVTADFSVNSGNDVDSSDNNFTTRDEGVTTLEENVFSEGNMDQNPNSISQGNQNLRRSSRQSVFPKNYNDFVVDSTIKYEIEKYGGYSKLNFENYCFITQLNNNFEPKSFSEASKFPYWIDAMNQEMNVLLRNGTWDIVDLPKDRKVIGSKWIYKIKYQSNGEIDRFKARLVAHGFSQKECIYYEETFSLVVKMMTVRCLLNIDVSQSWPIFQLDVNNAFLYGDLDEVVYMRPPEGYFPSGNKVCKLKKSLYGLKQAPRQWNAKLTSTLTENGFSQSKSDYSLFTKTDKGVFLALLVYVDDIIITGNNVAEIENFKVLDLLSEYGMLACKPIDTPLLSKLVIFNEATESDPLLENITDYQKLIVSSQNCFQDIEISERLSRKPVTGYCVFFNNSLISLKSKKQNILSKSSTEAEYRALASVTSEVI